MRKTLLAVLCLPAVSVAVGPDTFRERFADPETRPLALAGLIPGTRDFYFHTALDHQLAGRDQEFRKTIAEWKAATERPLNRVSGQGLGQLENRQLLISYAADPQASLDELSRRLDLRFDATRPDAAAAAGQIPTRLDPALVTEAAFEAIAREETPNEPYTRYSGTRLLRELDRVEDFDVAKIRWFIQKLDRADHPGVVPLIRRSLALEKPVAFGSADVHRLLTDGQLAALLEQHPPLRSSEEFHLAYLTKLRPGTATDFARDPAAHAAHLLRCRDHVLTLPPALNSLKAHVLHHHLRLQAALGQYPLDDFLAYLVLPRLRHDILRVPEAATESYVKLDADFSAAAGCRPVVDESELIDSLLRHHLGRTDRPDDFAALIREETLGRLHARARLLAGGDPARWAAALTPAEFKELQEESLVEFPATRPLLFDAAAEVKLELDLKNTPDLLVRIYELDLPAHLARHGTEPAVDIDLDGLVPHHERRLAFDVAPIVRHRRTIDLPELAGPGAWLVDFVSGRVSARALIRKGSLTPYLERNAAGQTIRVFDETNRPAAAAVLTLGSESYTADAAGRITVPDAPNQPPVRGVVRSGKLAAPVELGPRTDSIKLDAWYYLDREQLLADHETSVLVRTRLTNYGHELPLERLENPSLVLKAELLGGVTTERVIAENLTLKPVMEVPFQVPADLLGLTLTLRGTVVPATGGDPLKLAESTTWRPNGDLKSPRIASAFFSPVAGGHRLELRGRNGEPLPSRVVTLECHRFDYVPAVRVRVRSDEQGRIDLGRLDTIDYLEVSGTDIGNTLYEPNRRVLSTAAAIHQTAGGGIRIPLENPAAAPDRLTLSLLETLDGSPLRDHFGKLAIENGVIVIRDLPPGSYHFTQGDNETEIEISAGAEIDGLLVSPVRILPLHTPRQPSVQSATADDGEVAIQLRDHGADTRVSVIGRRHAHDEWDPGTGVFAFSRPLPATLTRGFLGCGYLTDRRLTDEMRYIFDRRAEKMFPGSMLPRPGLLLHRWTEEDLHQDTLLGGEGRGGRGRGESVPAAMSKRPAADRRRERSDSTHPVVCDFLARPAVTRFDLAVPEDGALRLPLADFDGCQFLEIIATDAFADDTFLLALPANDTPTRDRRIARPLDPETPFVATRSAAVLAKDATATIENLLDADWRAFTTMADAHQLLFGMLPDHRLRDFVFLTEWPELAEERKLELLESHACHELHLFLSRRDRQFFERHVKPMLAEKPEPAFIDDLLLERELTPYLRPFAWQNLNAAEKALLGRALPPARERVARELMLRWELEAPAPELETRLFTQTLRGTDLAIEDSLGLARRQLRVESETSTGVAYKTEKLRRIIIPRIDFEDTTVEEAIDFLRMRATELDATELDPGRRGVNFVIRRPAGGAAASDPGQMRIRELRLRNVPLSEALKYICDATRLRYRVDDYAVTLVPQTETGEDLMTRTFQVPPDFTSSMDGGSSPDVDPFAETTGQRLAARSPIADLLRNAGINLPPGSSATLSPNGVLLVTASPSELDKVDQLTMSLASSGPGPGRQRGSMGFGGDDPFGMEPEEEENGGSGAGGVDPFAAADFEPPELPNSVGLRLARPPLLFPERTRLWRESYYFRHAGATDETLIPLNRFWIDLAAWDGQGAFLSPHFNSCHRSASEALMCLALLDLPFQAGRPEVTVDGSSLHVKARDPMILFYKDTRRADEVAAESPLLVRQSFLPLAEKSRTVDGREVENPVIGDFQPGIAYCASLVVTNPTGLGRRIDLLAQIPAGAIPLDGHTATLSSTHEIAPHGVVMEELAFYFPAPGEFGVYPLHVSAEGVVLSRTEPRVLRVSADPAPEDAAAWGTLARDGTNEEVLDRLRTENLDAIRLDLIHWRMADRDFHRQTAAILRERLHFSGDISFWGFHHNDPATIRDYLENSDAVHQLGAWLDSPLLEVRPRVHHDWRTLEFDPLVNPRAHRFAGESQLTHPAARDHYHALLDQLAWKPALDDADHLSLAAFLFLQDRVQEALERFAKVDPEKLPGRVHYDYLHAVARFYQEQPGQAAAMAARRLPGLPPGLWRDRFQSVADQAAEIAAIARPGEDRSAAEDAAAPRLEIARGETGKLVIRHHGLERATLRLFSVDLEVLFSKDPFLDGGDTGSGEPAIRPNHSLEIPLAADVGETIIELPEPLRRGNLLAAADAGSARLLRVLDSSALDLRLHPATRTLRVTAAATGKPLPKTYVKVYARSQAGEVVFHKDGYTDLRGAFDYLSHTATDVSTIRSLAIFASHPDHGARTTITEK